MRLGHVVAQERLRRGLSSTNVADTLGLSVRDYEALEAGDSGTLEEVAMLLVNFSELTGGPARPKFNPCGPPPQVMIRAFEEHLTA